MAEQEGVKETSPTPSALENAIASSPEVIQEAQQSQGTQTPTAEQGVSQEQEQQQGVQEEEPRVPYSRLKEVVDEKNWYRQQLEQMMQRPQQPVIQQPAQDPYAGMSAEERVFWQNVDKRAEEKARNIVQQEMQQVRPVIDAGRMELAQMKVQQFRAQHPDIKPNSPEELAIAQRIQMNYSPDDAYWSVMGPRGIRQVEQQVKQQNKQKIEEKRKANIEATPSVTVSQAQKGEEFDWRTAKGREERNAAQRKKFREDFNRNLAEAEKGSQPL